tara:strand:- start:733 stop:945 length:213 start_codon:yes stop_codon:yes gene_type:complete
VFEMLTASLRLIFTVKEIKELKQHNSDMKRLLLPLSIATLLFGCSSVENDSSKRVSLDDCPGFSLDHIRL